MESIMTFLLDWELKADQLLHELKLSGYLNHRLQFEKYSLEVSLDKEKKYPIALLIELSTEDTLIATKPENTWLWQRKPWKFPDTGSPIIDV